ncbi:MAG: hypothetical protein ACE5JE_02570 [Thermoplasmata archaeon]
MILAKAQGLGSRISLEVGGDSYDVAPARRGLFGRIVGQAYSVVDRSSGRRALVTYRVLRNRIEVERGDTRATLRLRTVRPSTLIFDRQEYRIKFGKLKGSIDIVRDGEIMATGSLGTSSVRFQEAEGPLGAILPELAVGLCIWLKNFQGFLGAMIGGQA